MIVLSLDPGTRMGYADTSGDSGSIALWVPGKKGKPGKPGKPAVPPTPATPDVLYTKGPKKGQVRKKGKPGKPGKPAVPPTPAIPDAPTLPKTTRLTRLLSWLTARYFDADTTFDHIVMESVHGFSRGANSTAVGIGLRAIVELWGLLFGVPVTSVQAGDLKSFATGKSNAKKEEMLKAAKKKLGYEREEPDEDEVDALWGLAWALKHVC